jgi:molybdate transport system ATP-binding protein
MTPARGCSSRPPAGQSASDCACNTWPARVAGLTRLADGVRLDLDGQPSALADVAPAAVAELSLGRGSQVWLRVRPADLEIYPRVGGTTPA